ncbi:MAG: ribbon-helix-helix protein, CopG family [Bryobacteraceae bacterium]|nr:ribbon-helix-helix protein, CopG family [Bryobacteraceae bacterium]
MDALIPNLDDSTYRAIRARAALEGRPVGELITEALRAYLARMAATESMARLLDEPEERVSARPERPGPAVDEVVYLYCI